jgi:catechol 2,3-dioxygenase-like lactoylglutathione lyase family enzyme
MSIRRLHHTSIPMPIGGNDEARRFYTGVLGLREIPPPSTLSRDRLVWFSVSDDGDELHVLTVDDFQPNTNGQHLCLVVDDLDAVRQALVAAGLDIGEEPTIAYRPRFSFRDPFNNKIEITEINGDYLDAER